MAIKSVSKPSLESAALEAEGLQAHLGGGKGTANDAPSLAEKHVVVRGRRCRAPWWK